MKRLAIALLVSCGYTPLASAPSGEKLHVVLSASNVPDAVASDEVLAGVRDELAKAGALEPGDGYPRCEVEILRADEASEGIAAANGEPVSRATRTGIVARAWIVRTKDAPRERDTGDVRAMETSATQRDARAASFAHTDTLRSAARRAGHRLATRVLGLPSASDD